MNLIEIIKNKYLPIFRNDQLRVILTIIGITVAGVIFLSGRMLVDSFRANMDAIIDELPDDVIVHQNISDKHYNYLRTIDSNEQLIPFEVTELSKHEYINRETYNIPLNIIGTHNQFISSCIPYKDGFPVSKINNLQGRVWTATEAEQKLNVVVITYFTSKMFFGDANPIGKSLLIPGYGEFTVIGVINDLKEHEDSYSNLSLQGSKIITPIAHIFMPLATYKKYDFNYSEGYTSVLLQQHNEAKQVLIALQQSDYQNIFKLSYSKASSIDRFEEDLEVYKLIFTIVFVVILVFSFIIIVNTMLFSIKGRINEIGIRVALGASKRHIILQFIFEALILAFFALLLSLLIIYFAIQVLNIGFFKDFFFTISYESIIKYIIGLSMTILLASSLPAYYASRINVIDTLRME